MKKFKIAELISTFLFIGKKAKFCPGTFGSIATLPLWFLIISLVAYLKISPIIFIPFITVIISLFGFWATKVYLAETNQEDPKEVVIDEVVGQLLSFIFSFSFVVFLPKNLAELSKFLESHLYFSSFFLFITPIIFFRIFDIKKPLFIGWADKNIKNAYGVMLDDIFAGICAGLLNSIIIYLWFIFFK